MIGPRVKRAARSPSRRRAARRSAGRSSCVPSCPRALRRRADFCPAAGDGEAVGPSDRGAPARQLTDRDGVGRRCPDRSRSQDRTSDSAARNRPWDRRVQALVQVRDRQPQPDRAADRRSPVEAGAVVGPHNQGAAEVAEHSRDRSGPAARCSRRHDHTGQRRAETPSNSWDHRVAGHSPDKPHSPPVALRGLHLPQSRHRPHRPRYRHRCPGRASNSPRANPNLRASRHPIRRLATGPRHRVPWPPRRRQSLQPPALWQASFSSGSPKVFRNCGQAVAPDVPVRLPVNQVARCANAHTKWPN